ncbi:hypothetical protein PCANC_09214 [Puccinia coronata f. sp. avenae]|uniref:Major facilitator superfamily (MFS) profile domain-containing protein n=1 Tax=Puccinia coronata f. sp. avenae TaxID=200324 RepID=A0A2N5SZC0_9BASI|nr:hypothetical protein PCANC_09214 [Puccinia coronata f. sp. avenae]
MSIITRWRSQASRDPARQPLLSPGKRVGSECGETEVRERPAKTQNTPLPCRQVLVLCFMRITEPISQSLIHPFINQMLEDLHVTPDRTKIGYYAGIITSLFAFSQLCTNFWWAMLSDRVGRKPILLSGLTGLAISMISLSLQTSFAGMVVARCVAGVMNGNLPILKSVLAEITDDTNKARAFSLIPMCNAVGIIVGPLIGGYLAKPASQYPDYFGYVQFLVDYPYFLPCFIAGMINLFAVTIGFFFLEETLASKKTHNNLSLSDQGNEHDIQEDVEPEEAAQNVPQPKPRFVELFTPSIISVLFSSLLVFFQMSSLATLIPLFAYTRFEDGGLGLNLRQMGTALTTNGFAAVVVQTVTFPYLQRRWGTVKVFRTVLLISPIVFVLLPVVHSLVQARRDASGVDAGARMAMVGIMVVLAIKSLGKISIVCLTLLVNSAAPSASTFGTLNGLAQSTADLARTFAPFMTGAVFSMSIDQQYLHGNLVWVCGLLLSCMTLFFAHTTTIIHPPRIPKTRHNLPSSSHV